MSTGDFSGLNLFVYCGNNPVNRFDPTGHAWYHWAIGAAVVAGFAIATVVTCGGFAAAATAVGLVSSGVALSSATATAVTAAFIGSATVYGTAVLAVAGSSNSLQDFADHGNWGTVFGTALGAGFGMLGGYNMYRSQQTPSYTSRGSTGRTEPQNLKEKLAMEQVRADPLSNSTTIPIKMTDPRWPSTEGWVKKANNVNGVEIHFVYNEILYLFDDFKFKG